MLLRVPRVHRRRRSNTNHQKLSSRTQRTSRGRLRVGQYVDTVLVLQAQRDGRRQPRPSMTLGVLREDPAQVRTRRRIVIVAERFRHPYLVALETHLMPGLIYRRFPPSPPQHPIALGCHHRNQAPNLSRLPNGLRRRVVVSVCPINRRTRSTGWDFRLTARLSQLLVMFRRLGLAQVRVDRVRNRLLPI